jgi:hypothetical protein
VLLSMMACEVDLTSLGRPADAVAPALDAPPPAAEGPEQETLYQLLFAGELGGHAHVQGQRARMLVWFRSMKLSADQLRSLAGLADTLGERRDRIAMVEAEVTRLQGAALAKVYDGLIALLASEGDLDPAALKASGTALATAREAVPSETLLRVRHDELRGMLTDARIWMAELDDGQRTALGTSRFLLRHRVGALTTPGDHADLLGTEWDGASFDSLMIGRVPQRTEPLDIGGLWATETVRGTPDHKLGAAQNQVLVLLACQEPGLVPAIQVALGEREPLDFTDAALSPD